MFANAQTSTILFIIQLLILFGIGEGGSKSPFGLRANDTDDNSTSSPWLKKTFKPRDPGCWKRQWICKQPGEWPPTKRCCKNVCVDVTTDVNNCGKCGVICPFLWQCCRGFCSNTNISPLNCGKCGNICPIGIPCYFGMCGYAQPVPPWPFPPFPPRPPFPPFPPRPPFPPFPPRPPFPPKPPLPPKPPMPPFPPKPPMPPMPPFPPKPPMPPLPPMPPRPPAPPTSDQ
ncbi:hypothetical protein TIFTF001_020797 [Ficus carica]|uniref:Stigma-specific protein Stig1 n=1 Tax=Ficus carica TaxID=3494 RepID=A0AA88AYC6_FICCA|nr:hypothetical protein TIFTF001_020797 [Ficus carica]